jgi:hypothetical protein
VRAPRLHGLAGATLAVGVFAAALVFPASLEDGPRTILPAEPGVAACLSPRCDTAHAGVLARVDAELARRMADAPVPERSRLASAIVAEAVGARIDPLLVVALIHVESSFDPSALSVAGARGLMQLREPTLRRELQRAGLPHLDVHDPVTNVRAGVRYLRRLLDAFGREEVALMAYNAGPNRILRYLREGAIPERFHAYPRRIQAVHRKLRRHEPGPALALARTPAVPE